MSFFGSSSDLPRLRRLSSSRTTTVSVLDIGSTKICCLIGKLRPRGDSSVLPGRSHAIEVIGFGHQRSRGIKSGVVVDMDAAEQALRLAVDRAERSAGVTVDSLVLAVSAGRLSSDTFSSGITLGGGEVAAGDIRAVMMAGNDHVARSDRATLHALPIGYTLDSRHGIENPLSMVGEELGVDMHVVSADVAPLRNLENCVNRAHLSVDGMVATSYASGLAALVDDEARMGCACIDMGGGTTTVSIFFNNRLVFADAITVGGNHVTMDLARVLSTPVEDAERMKVLHGTALTTQLGEGEMVSIAPIGDDPRTLSHQISVGQMAQIIRPRIEETFELVRERINRSGFAGVVGKRVVITGGASQLGGISEVAGRVLGANIRIGRPMGVAGLPKTAKGPAFSAAAGLLIYPQIADIEYVGRSGGFTKAFNQQGSGAFARMGRWLRESF